jgi:hypothetical protein
MRAATDRRRLVVAAALLLALSTSARAAPGLPEAKAHLERAQAYLKLKQPRQAIVEFEEAFKWSGGPNMLYNIGECYRALGMAPGGAPADLQQAIEHFRRFLAMQPRDRDRPRIEKWISEMQDRIVEASLPAGAAPPTSTTSAPPPTAATAAPAPPTVPPSRQPPAKSPPTVATVARSRAPAKAPAPREAPPTSPAATPTSDERATPAPAPVAPTAAADSPQPSRPARSRRLVGAEVGLGIGIAVGVAAIAYGALAISQDGTPACRTTGPGVHCPNVVDGTVPGAIFVGVGGAITIASAAILAVLEVRARHEAPPPVSLAPLAWRDGGGLAVGGAW